MIKISGKSGGAAVYTNLVSLEKLAALGVTAAVIGVMAAIVRPERSKRSKRAVSLATRASKPSAKKRSLKTYKRLYKLAKAGVSKINLDSILEGVAKSADKYSSSESERINKNIGIEEVPAVMVSSEEEAYKYVGYIK